MWTPLQEGQKGEVVGHRMEVGVVTAAIPDEEPECECPPPPQLSDVSPPTPSLPPPPLAGSRIMETHRPKESFPTCESWALFWVSERVLEEKGKQMRPEGED